LETFFTLDKYPLSYVYEMLYMSRETYVGLHVKYQILFLNSNESGMCRQILVKISNIKFHENPFSNSRGILCRQDKYGEAERHISANTPKLITEE
jgi:hypothetical protein